MMRNVEKADPISIKGNLFSAYSQLNALSLQFQKRKSPDPEMTTHNSHISIRNFHFFFKFCIIINTEFQHRQLLQKHKFPLKKKRNNFF